ncbi:MAG: amino acid permease [Candidatus Marinimicrobia bacterium]|nr:amino acid permease [Candidatus Neomarinimicrobiota bacterium]
MQNRPKRVIKTFDATAMVTGNMIGSGIFLLAGYAASPVVNGNWLILAWIFGGIMALLGALSIAELATKFPHTGGDFLYLHKVYGSFPAFLYGWMSMVIFASGSIAILALFGAKYLIQISPVLSSVGLSEKVIALILVTFYTFIHFLRVTVGSRFQSILTVVKLFGMFVLAYLLFQGQGISLEPVPSPKVIQDPISGFSRALIPIFFAYSGWNVAGYLAGEIANPRKTLPIALIGGTMITTVIYLIVNYTFLSSLGLEHMRNESLVPLMAIRSVGAENWSQFLSVLIFVSVVSSLSIAVQAGARVIQSMGDHGVFFKKTAKVHSRFHTPVVALVIQGVWTVMLMFLLDIESLVDSATIVMVLFSALTISSLLKKKGRQSKNHSSKKDYFRTPLFPLIPIAYIGSALFVSWGVIRFYLEQGSYLPALGFLFIGIGSGIYWVWKKFGVGKPV